MQHLGIQEPQPHSMPDDRVELWQGILALKIFSTIQLQVQRIWRLLLQMLVKPFTAQNENTNIRIVEVAIHDRGIICFKVSRTNVHTNWSTIIHTYINDWQSTGRDRGIIRWSINCNLASTVGIMCLLPQLNFTSVSQILQCTYEVYITTHPQQSLTRI